MIMTRSICGGIVWGLVLCGGGAAIGRLAAQDRAQAPAPSTPTFSEDVAPIFYRSCVSCHRPGEIGPMSLISYSDVRPWARSIREKVGSRVMPPWHADPHYGTFRNDRSLSQTEVATIVSWVDAGARQGDPADLPPMPQFADGWQIGQPDAVFEMPAAFEIPASGVLGYKTYNVPTNFTTDMWVVAAEIRVADRAHVHHVVVTIRDPGGNKSLDVLSVEPLLQEGTAAPTLTAADLESRRKAEITRSALAEHRLVGYNVGQQPPVLPPGLAKRVPAGSILSFSMHYTTNGTPGTDRTKVGLIFAKQPPRQEVLMGDINNGLFEIPPGSANTKVESIGSFSKDVKIWAFHPHMHIRGKDMTYTAVYPDGREEVLLKVPSYHFDWELDYYLAEPKLLPKGSKIHVTAHYDNSTGNKNNPDPTATVRFGDQIWDEMMAAYFTYTVEDGTLRGTASGVPPGPR
jgi:hypothetical protein